MSRSFDDIFREAAELSDEDRAALAGLLIRTLDPPPEEDVESAWSQEIARRLAEVDSGQVN
jgi:hypothetical protein